MRKRKFAVGVAQMDGAAHINGLVIVKSRLCIDQEYCQQAIPDDRAADHPTPALVRHNATLASVVRESEKAAARLRSIFSLYSYCPEDGLCVSVQSSMLEDVRAGDPAREPDVPTS